MIMRIFKKRIIQNTDDVKKTIETVNVESRKVGLSKLNSRCMSLQKLICIIVYTTDCITCTSANMVRWAGRASMVIMNQEEKNVNKNTSKDADNVKYYVMLVTALGGARLYKFAMLGEAGVTNLLKTDMNINKVKHLVKQRCCESNN